MRQDVQYPGDDGYWIAECPSLVACVNQEATRQEAISNIKEAIAGYIIERKEDGLSVPEENCGRPVVYLNSIGGG